MGDWLGTGIIASQLRNYRTFGDARDFVRSLLLRNQGEWALYCKGKLPEKAKKPDDIPAHPNEVYRDQGWVSIGDGLGTGSIANFLRQYRPFEEARGIVRRLGGQNQKEWNLYCRGKMRKKGEKPVDIPANPHRTYKDKGWISYGDWLGTYTIAPFLLRYRPFKEARDFVNSLGLKGQKTGINIVRVNLLIKSQSQKISLLIRNPHIEIKDG